MFLDMSQCCSDENIATSIREWEGTSELSC